MKKILLITLFMLATLVWAAAQQPGSTPQGASGQATSPRSQAPGSQSQPSTGGSPDQGRAGNAPVTEGCLGGKAPNFTITDKAGTSYKLNIPPNADTAKLASHVGEPVQVLGEVKDAKAGNPSIDVQGIGSATGHCPAGNSSGAQSPPKQ